MQRGPHPALQVSTVLSKAFFEAKAILLTIAQGVARGATWLGLLFGTPKNSYLSIIYEAFSETFHVISHCFLLFSLLLELLLLKTLGIEVAALGRRCRAVVAIFGIEMNGLRSESTACQGAQEVKGLEKFKRTLRR